MTGRAGERKRGLPRCVIFLRRSDVASRAQASNTRWEDSRARRDGLCGVMRYFLVTLILGWSGVAAAQSGDPALSQLCATNPAYSPSVMRAALESQLEKDHDPALDATPPDQLADQAVAQGIGDCVTDLQKDSATRAVLAGLKGSDLSVGWDAYNTTCSDHTASKSACIQAELGSVGALKRMVATDQPPGAKALVETCELVVQPDPAMADWRQCVDQGLAVHASKDRAATCKVAVTWHAAKTGAEAGKIVSACLSAP